MNRLRDWLRSFRYAYEGILFTLTSQRNMKVHFMVAFIIVMFAIFLRVGATEVLFILLAITLMIVTELINTAVEKTVDLAMPKQHPLAKIAKDTAAAAVLVSALFSLAVGMIVFYEPVIRLLSGLRGEQTLSTPVIWLFVAIVLLGTIAIHTRFARYTQSSKWRPSMMSALTFSIATTLLMLAENGINGMLAIVLAIITLFVLYEKTERSYTSLFIGALIGVFLTIMAFTISWL